MVKDVKHKSFRCKFCIAATLSIAFLLYAFRLYPTTWPEGIGKGVVTNAERSGVPAIPRTPTFLVRNISDDTRVKISHGNPFASTKWPKLANSPVVNSKGRISDNTTDVSSVISLDSQAADSPFVIRIASSSKQNVRQPYYDPVPVDIQYIEDNFLLLNQKDYQLIQYTRVRHLTPPSKLKYNLMGNNSFNVYNECVASFFKNKRNGIFLDAGANRGENGSSTLYLEQTLGWTGLLVECNPLAVPYLRRKNRNAWIADVCLSLTAHPAILNITSPTKGNPIFAVQAIPLYTILAALEWKEIDFFSFDIGGKELGVLKKFPFNLVRFEVIMVEVYYYTDVERKALNDLLISKDYILTKEFSSEFSIKKIYVQSTDKSRMFRSE